MYKQEELIKVCSSSVLRKIFNQLHNSKLTD